MRDLSILALAAAPEAFSGEATLTMLNRW